MIIFVKRVGRIFKILGLDIKAISALRHLPKYINNVFKFRRMGGKFYLGIPIGKADEVYFNAHRVFAPDSILKFDCVADSLKLVRFDLVNDSGDLEINMNVEEAVGKYNYGFGI